jgi:protein-tyrosine kinase
MSKIYEALEKAERDRDRDRDREKEFKNDVPLIRELREVKAEEQEIRIEPKELTPYLTKHPLISYFQPESLAAEQIRKLRAYLQRVKGPDSPKSIMVTSAGASEGKTFVAANLAAGIANDLHAHALLVDCDLRNSSLTDWFNLPKNRGLSDYLDGNGAAFSDFIIGTGLEKLSVFPAGSVKENPTELIGSKKMEGLVQELKLQQDNRYIILDATPVLATTEPEVLSKLADAIIFVVRAGVTPRENIQQAIRALDAGKIIGVVLNDLVFKSPGLHSRYFGSNGYYYKYGYGKSKDRPQSRWIKLLRRKG